MHIDATKLTMTYDGLPIGVDTYFKCTDMVAATTSEICIKAPTVRNKATVTHYWTIVLTYNAAGEILKQAAAIESETAPSWIGSL